MAGGKLFTVTHGMRDSKEYNTWGHVKARCNRPTDKSYKHYGGRGITICDRWLHSFENFYADMGKCPEGMSIERINNDGNYEPSNCRWATQAEQVRNQRRNHIISFNGKTMVLSDWAAYFKVSPARLCTAIRKEGKTLEEFSHRRKWVRKVVADGRV